MAKPWREQKDERLSTPPLAILGYHMDLPCKRDITGDDLVEIIQKREFVGVDVVEKGILDAWEYDGTGNPWLFQNSVAHKYTQDQEGQWGDTALMQVSEKEKKFMSMLQLVALEAVWKALEKCGIPLARLHKTRTGVFVAGYQIFGGFESYPDETSLRGGLMSGLSDRISYFLGTHGPSLTLETACSSSLVAMTIAANSIRNGSCDVAILVCINIFNHEYELALQATGVVSKEGKCKPFDGDASGTIRCEGFGCMILSSMEWAQQNNYDDIIQSLLLNATIGSAGADAKAKEGSGRVYEAPNVEGMAEMIRLCHQQINLPLEEIAYVEAHATGTSVGDLIELNALKKVYQQSHDSEKNPLRVGSIKGNIGHAEISAGLFSTIKVVEMLKRRTFLPTGGRDISPRQDFDWNNSNIKLCLDSERFPAKKRVCIGVNSFGVGGSYAHAILCEYQGEQHGFRQGNVLQTSNRKNMDNDTKIESPLVFSISAASIQHLDEYESRIVSYLCCNPSISLLGLCGYFTMNRTKLRTRRHYLVKSVDDLIFRLRMEPKTKASEGMEHGNIAMVFTGQGSQWVTMGSKLMYFKVYRDIVIQFDSLYKKLSGLSPISLLSSLNEECMAETMHAQPLTFMVQLGLIELLKYVGVTPNVVLGHSAGEIAALYCSGRLTLEEATKVVFHRSCCQQALAGNGRMLAVQAGKEEASKVLRKFSSAVSQCHIACYNSPRSVVIGGPTNELDILQKHFVSIGVKNTFLRGNTAFHTKLMDSILEDVENRLSFLSNNPSYRICPFISTVTGLPLDRISPEYIAHNIRQPVQFSKAVSYLMNQYEPEVILEVGPHKTLAPLLVECIGKDYPVKVLTSMSKQQDELQSFWQLIMGMLENGINVDLSSLYTDMGYRFTIVADCLVPGHPFLKTQEKSLTVERKKIVKGKWDVGPAAGTMESRNDSRLSVVEICKATCPSMAEHVMGGQPLLPGMYFVEAAIEVWAYQHQHCSVILSEVSFQAMCPIPERSKNQETKRLFVRQSSEETNGLIKFTVESKPLQRSDITVHCTGAMTSFTCPDVLDGTKYICGKMGFKEKKMAVRDIGLEGIKSLMEFHTDLYSKKQVYDLINIEGVTEYGPSFQVVKEVRMNSKRSSLISLIEYDHMSWNSKGGIYGIQLLDGILQLGFLSPYADPGSVTYAGGFDLGIFARKPVSNPCIVHVKFPEEEDMRHGKVFMTGNAWMYDSQGRLLLYVEGIRCIIGKKITRTFDSIQIWHPISLPEVKDSEKAVVFSENGQRKIGSRAIAGEIFNIARRKEQMMTNKFSYVRILEYWEDSSQIPKVFESLVSVEDDELPSDIRILAELFIATHNRDVLQKGFHVPSKQRRWLRIRLVFLPSALDILEGLCFDVIAAWQYQNVEEGQGQEPSELVQDVSRFGLQGCLLLHDFVANPESSAILSYQNDLGEGIFSSKIRKDVTLKHVSKRMEVLLMSKEEKYATEFATSLSKLGATSRSILQICTIPNSNTHDIWKLVDDFKKYNQENEKHIVLLDGLVDQSKYAQETFIKLAKVAQCLHNVRAHVWIVGSNIYSHPINVNRCSLAPLVSGMIATFPSLTAKFVDMENPTQTFDVLAALLMHNPGPWQLMIDRSGTVHESILVPIEIGSPAQRRPVSASEDSVAYKCELIMEQNGMVEYDYFAHPVQAPGNGDVLVEVHAASLNFRDVMLSLNALPASSFEGSFYGFKLGMEASGIVKAVGEGVTHVKAGDPVSVSESGCFVSKLLAPASRVLSLAGSSISLEQAATISSVYCTAYHSLIDLCSIKKGEKVLIHAAAGGVGHAAISICKHIGAEIYVTASEPKQEYCANVLNVPKSRIFNSRNTSWFDALMHASQDEGVDVVLNCLAGEHQRLGLECLRPGGRFCEIGKIDVFNNESLFLFAFRKNIRLYVIDMDRMTLDSPDLVQEIRSKVFEHIAKGDFDPLPFRTFPMDRISDAIELMKSGSHIGKILLTNFVEDQPLAISTRDVFRVNPASYVLILGGAGGFGSRMVRWAFKKGARKFITTVSSNPSRVNRIFEDLIREGAIFEVIEADLSKQDDLQKIEEHLMGSKKVELEMMIHCAGIYQPFYFDEVSDNVLERQADIKIGSAIFLHELSMKMKGVKYFIIVGSNSSELVQPFMASYAATNAMLGGIARQRQSLNLPCTILHMSSIKDVGMVSKDEASLEFQKRFRMEFVCSSRAIAAFEKMLSDQTSTMVHAFFVSHQMMKQMGVGWNGARTTPPVDTLLVFGECSEKATGNMHITYSQTLERVIWLLRDTLGIDEEITATSSLSAVGIDSLGMLEFRQFLQDEFSYTIDRTAFAMSVGDLAKDIHDRLKTTAAHDDRQVDDTTKQEDRTGEQEAQPSGQEEAILRRHYSILDPEGYVIAIPGLDLNGFYFTDWRSDAVQILVVNLKKVQGTPGGIAKIIASAIDREGYLSDRRKQLIVMGYSYGCFIGLELCRELCTSYSFSPATFIPVAYAAPHVCRSNLHFVPTSALRRKIIYRKFRQQILREYGRPDPNDQQVYQVYLQRPTLPTIFQWEEDAQAYFRQVCEDLKTRSRKDPYIGGNIPIHYFFAKKDQIGNPKRIPDPRLHGWDKYTSGVFKAYGWHAMHSLIVDPYVGSLFKNHVLEVIHEQLNAMK